MKKISKIVISSIIIVVMISACSKDDFADNYPDPSKISESTVEKMYSGFLYTNRQYVLPAYTNYFVVLRTTLLRYTQAVGWVNENSQYVPGEAGISGRWNNYYQFLAHYRELEKIYNALPTNEQEKLKIFMMTATIYLYDHTQKVVDLHGDIPFYEAGKLSQNGGDYLASLAPYDTAESIYTTMLDGLKNYADQLNAINLDPAVEASFKAQDFVNNGDLELWKKYCNSLRLRMLTRVSAAPDYASRAQSEIATILGNPSQYPLVETNAENIQIDVVNVESDINSRGFRDGLEGFSDDVARAGKAMIDHMNTNGDPRLRAMYEEDSNGGYSGIDPLLDETTQAIDYNNVSTFNRSTLNHNEYFPGLLITAAEVNLLKAEAYLGVDDAMAKTSYEEGIKQSVEFYYWVRTLSTVDLSGPLAPLGSGEIAAYTSNADVNWNNATSTDDKLALIATQKWIDFSVLRMPESWAEQRRLDLPNLSFRPDNANAQTLPPSRWIYPSGERTHNTDNYQAVSGEDNLTTKLFWDVN